MSFEDCVRDAVDEGSAEKSRADRAMAMWKDAADRYERQGRPRHIAEALAGEDVKAAFKKEAGDVRHVFLARLANNRKLQADLENATDLKKFQTQNMERVDYKSRALVRRFNARLAGFLREHHRDILGRVTKPAQLRNVVREMHGEATGDAAASALAKGVREALEDMRLMANEAGATIGKLENYGLPHSHSRRAVVTAGRDKWMSDIIDDVDWTKIDDHMTGRPMQAEDGPPPSREVQERFLGDIYDNIAYGKGSKEAVYGRAQGSALYNRMAQSRVLHFKDADGWVEYNKRYGTGDPYKSLMGHVHNMARDIVMLREFGPNPGMGIDYQKQLAIAEARKRGRDPDDVISNAARARQMFNIHSGGAQPETLFQDYLSTFLSSARHVMTSAFLDRAILASVSDINTLRLSAEAVGLNPQNVISRHTKLMASSMERADAQRAQWIADTLADPGVALARFQAEVPPAEVAERLSSASMRIQGLSGWTDMGKIAFQMEMAGLMASQAGRSLDKVDEPLQSLLKSHGLTADQWSKFTNKAHFYKSGNGATFASPNYWRQSTDLPDAEAEDIFFKIQGLIEEQTEYAVPTQSLLARSYVDPAAYGAQPGSIAYEAAKSGLMFKSFAMTFTVNQFRRMAAMSTWQERAVYGMNLAAGATMMGAVSLQLAELAKGNEPMSMDTANFWGRATLRGGAFGVIGDIVSTGESSWGGGFASYIAGPVPQMIGDAWNISIGNGIELATGEDTNFAAELSRLGKRYTPMGQTPLVGPAIDRLFWDQMQLFLDPESSDALMKASRSRQNRDGNASWWMPGEALPG